MHLPTTSFSTEETEARVVEVTRRGSTPGRWRNWNLKPVFSPEWPVGRAVQGWGAHTEGGCQEGARLACRSPTKYVAHACIPSTGEIEVGGPEIEDRYPLYSQFEAAWAT